MQPDVRRRRPSVASGSALVLVIAVLVLLVIIATAFLSRSRSVRAQAGATQLAAGRDARVNSVVADLAQGIADSLFLQPIDKSTYDDQVAANQATGLAGVPGLGEFFARSDFPRLPPSRFGLRYEVDMFDGSVDGDPDTHPGFDNRFLAPYVPGAPNDRLNAKVDGYNYAPFVVSPFTNWPLRYGRIDGESDFRQWFTPPQGDPGAAPPGPYGQNYLIPTNPRGNPGFGDSRWLASTEPVRAEVRATPIGQNPRVNAFGLVLENGRPKITPEGLGFSHWPHLSWIATANNGFRVCWDISDVEANTIAGAAGTVQGELSLGTPYEQWLPYVAPRPFTMPANWTDPQGFLAFDWTDFRTRWARWFNRQPIAGANPNTIIPSLDNFGQPTGHMQLITGSGAQGQPQQGLREEAPPNFLQLAAYGDPSDEFKVYTSADASAGRMPPGYAVGHPKPRNLLARTLADADGDGWTDSFWFVAPTSADRGTKQVVAVRIADNSGLLNVNTATRFERSNTVGQTPADVALASRRESYDLSTTEGRRAAALDPAVGFLNAPENDPEWRAAAGTDNDRVAIMPVRKASSNPTAANPYATSGWDVLNTQYPAGNGPPADVNSGDYFAVYRSSPQQAIEVAFDPTRFEGTRARGGTTPGDATVTVNNVGVRGYFGSPSLLGQLGVIREGRQGDASSDNLPLPQFSYDDSIGIPGGNGDFFALTRQADRSTYFKAMLNGGAIVDPVTSSRRAELTPFGIDDEAELRAFTGRNDPQTITRLESALGWSFATGAGEARPLDQFLRSSRSLEESSRFLDPLDARLCDSGIRQLYLNGSVDPAAAEPRSGTELLLDHRRMLTTVSGARNEMLPPRLWTIQPYGGTAPGGQAINDGNRHLYAVPAYDEARDRSTANLGDPLLPPYHPNRMYPAAARIEPGAANQWDPSIAIADVDGNGRIDESDFLRARQRFINDNRKIDLRRAMDDALPPDNPNTGTRNETAIARGLNELRFAQDVQRVFRTALMDNSMRVSNEAPDSLFSRPGATQAERQWGSNWTKVLGASFAANLLCYRDGSASRPIFGSSIGNFEVDPPLFPSQREAIPWPEDVPPPAGINAPSGLGFVGVEAHPVIQEVFIAVVYPPNPIALEEVEDAWQGMPNPPSPLPDFPFTEASFPEDRRIPAPGSGSWPSGVLYPAGAGLFNASMDWENADDFGADGGAPAVVFVVQVANPFNVPVNLAEYEVRINGGSAQKQGFLFRTTDQNWLETSATADELKWGNTYGRDIELGPCTPEEPRTAIVFAVPERFPNGQPFPREQWLDFLDIGRSVDVNGDNEVDPVAISSGSGAHYPRTNGAIPYFPAGRPFPPDHAALFRAGWGADGRGGTLLFDATLPATDATGAEKTRPLAAFGAGFHTKVTSKTIMSMWAPAANGGTPGSPSYIELIRHVQSPLGARATMVVDRFENQVDPRSSVVTTSRPGADDNGGSQGETFEALARRTIPNPASATLLAQSDRARPPATRVAIEQTSPGSGVFRLDVDGTRFIDPQLRAAERDAALTILPSFLTTWVRGARQWLYDVDGDGYIASDERTPRFAFSRVGAVMGSSSADGSLGGRSAPGPTIVGNVERDTASRPQAAVFGSKFSPDGLDGCVWQDFTVSYWSLWNRPSMIRGSKPVFLSTRTFDDGTNRAYPRPATGDSSDDWWDVFQGTFGTASYGEKGVTDPGLVQPGSTDLFTAPFRLFQKDRDFDQVAEILDVPMWGPLVGMVSTSSGVGAVPTPVPTFVTLPEILAMPQNVAPGATGPSQGAQTPYPVFPLLFPMSARSALTSAVLQDEAPRLGNWQQQVSWNRLSIEPAVSTPLLVQERQALSNPGTPPVTTQLWGNQVIPSAYSEPGRMPAPRQNGIGFNARLPGVASLLDAFVIDDRGSAPLDENEDGSVTPTEWGKAEDRRFRLAAGFSGQRTPGLININTAPLEVLRALPHMTRLGYMDDYPIRVTSESDPSDLRTDSPLSDSRKIRDPRFWEWSPAERAVLGGGAGSPTSTGGASPFPTVRVASAIESYRNKLNPLNDAGQWTYPDSPTYVYRGRLFDEANLHQEFAPGMRSDRGFDSIGELGLLLRGAAGPILPTPNGFLDANNNGTPDARDVAMGRAVDFNLNGVPDPVYPLSTGFGDTDQPPPDTNWTWGSVMSWSMRYAGMDPFRTDWEEDLSGLGSRSSALRDADPPFPGLYTQGVPLRGRDGSEFTIGGRTAIDPHFLVAFRDDLDTPGPDENEADDPASGDIVETEVLRHDRTSGDALERNQLLRGISNIVTTRSDVFTMWVRVRTVRQDPLTGRWNATDPDSILDDSRYVLTIDRSNVDRPGDAPRILGFVKVPK
jgi:hypothetical protein